MINKVITFVVGAVMLPISIYASNSLIEIKSVREFDNLVKTSSQPIAAQFHSGCAVCNVTRRHLKEIIPDYSSVLFLEIDIEKVPNLAERYNIAALPTVLIFEPNKSEPTYTITGPNKVELESKINSVLRANK